MGHFFWEKQRVHRLDAVVVDGQQAVFSQLLFLLENNSRANREGIADNELIGDRSA